MVHDWPGVSVRGKGEQLLVCVKSAPDPGDGFSTVMLERISGASPELTTTADWVGYGPAGLAVPNVRLAGLIVTAGPAAEAPFGNPIEIRMVLATAKLLTSFIIAAS